ncbi:hypothetical protein Vdis_1885 [Vulcanisaeta distributa DSM 14429]|uniref:Uncharacterized protein n=2 Tax=Vulcanisaeta TaxID=164450 RepID=E1QNG9_VULDI|nr:hypothetical protein Vdis_1885 [Vulcanisaeta distributa DSM 14429]BDR91194.1 hypothetical protein Vsou_02870 [Vulcanisaeta souniana JCM 11219]
MTWVNQTLQGVPISGSMVRNWLEAVRRRVGLRYALMLDSSLREYASEFGIAPSRWL